MNRMVVTLAILLVIYAVTLKLTPAIPVTPSSVATVAMLAGVALLFLAWAKP